MGKPSIDMHLDNVRKNTKKPAKKKKVKYLPKYDNKKEARGRPKVYQEQVYLEPLKRIWLATDQL